MKKVMYLTSLVSLLFVMSCKQDTQQGSQEGNIQLSGTIENAGDLEYLLLAKGTEPIDTIELDQSNDFLWKGNAADPTLVTLQIDQKPYMLILEDGEEVEFQVDLENPDDYSVTGSETSAKLKELDVLRRPFYQQQENLQMEFQRRVSAGEDMSVVQSELLAENQEIMKELSQPVVEFAQENKDNLAGFYAMVTVFSVDPVANEEAVIAFVDEVKDEFPDNADVQSFAAHVEKIKPLSIGQVAPDFTSTTPEGEEVKLSDFRGKYVLLDFWAAWCAPCRDENPNIVAEYHAYKDKGFTVLGVSLDRDREAWLKAIEDDQLAWTQVSDLKMWQSNVAHQYNINAIPASFMLDPEGKIIGKNLRGPALGKFLEENL